jgi:Restriction endonuclease EcoRV
MSEFMEALKTELAARTGFYEVCGIVDRERRVYPLGSDTKVLSTIFELIARPVIFQLAEERGLNVIEPESQNHYPDFTLLKNVSDTKKIAIDVKTTYRKRNGTFTYTLGGYTSFIRKGNETKNIVFPFDQYAEHWVIGFGYDRVATKKSADSHIFDVSELEHIPLPFANVEFFMQEKWRISSDRAGSGNTTNIGSITATLEEFQAGKGVFKSEEEFLAYWRGYERTDAERQ